MNEQRKLIQWSPHARQGSGSPHAQEFVVCSTSLRLFRASTQLGSDSGAAAAADATAVQPLSRQLSAFEQAPQQQQPAPDPRAPGVPWNVTVKSHADYDAQAVLPRSSFDLLDTISYPGQVFRCLGWSLSSARPYMVGGGQAGGKLVVMNFAGASNGGSSILQGTGSGGSSGSGAGGEGGDASSSSLSRIVKEFQPRYARACHVVCWNPLQTNQVAVGLDRVRNGCGTLIWDVTQQGSTASVPTPAPVSAGSNSQFVQSSANILNTNPGMGRNQSTPSSSSAGIETVTEPLGRVSNSEATLSLNWLPNDPYSLAVGTGFKWLRIYDIRGNSRPTSVVAHAKSVNGVSFDPFNPVRLATFTDEGTMKIWDLRMLTRREIFQVHTNASGTGSSGSSIKGAAPKQLVEVEWCPTSQHRLATIHAADDCFKLWDLSGSLPALVASMPSVTSTANLSLDSGAAEHSAADFDGSKMPVSPEVVASAVGEQNESPPVRTIKLACLSTGYGLGGGVGNASVSSPQASLSSLSWHPSHKQRVLLITSHGLVEDMMVRDNVPVAFNPREEAPSFAVNEQMFMGRAITAPNASAAEEQAASKDPLTMLQPSRGPAVGPSFDPTLFLSQDISTRMRVRALLGYGLDLEANRRIAANIAHELRNSFGGGAARRSNEAPSTAREIERALLQEGLADEHTLVRVWEWMVQSERLYTLHKNAGDSGAAAKRGRFTGILSLLLPSLTSSSLATLDAAPISPVQQSNAAGGTTLLSLLQKPEASSSPSALLSAGAASSLSLSPSSTVVEPQAAQGFLPSGFLIYLSPQRSEALKLCNGWFDIFATDAQGALMPARRSRPAAASGPLNPATFPTQSHYLYELHITSLESAGRYEKAAMVAIFHLDLERALASLTLGAQRRQNQQQGAQQPQQQQQQLADPSSLSRSGSPSPADVAAGYASSATLSSSLESSEEGSRDLGLVAMALSGYANFAFHSHNASSNQGGAPPALHSLWNQTWTAALSGNVSTAGSAQSAAQAALSSSLKAIFSFLSTFAPRAPSAATYAALLSDSTAGGLDLQDKLGFILRFLPDSELLSYVLRITRQLVSAGDLDAVVLTGLNHCQMMPAAATATAIVSPNNQSQAPSAAAAAAPSAGALQSVSFTMELLQSYLDRTSDVQTAAILGCFAGVSINFASLYATQAMANLSSGAGASGALTSPSSAATAAASVPGNVPAPPTTDLNDPSISLSHWIAFYKSLLNQWQLWSERARFDVARALLEKSWWTDEEQNRMQTMAAAQQQGGGNSRGGSHGSSLMAPPLRKPAHHTQVRPHISARCNFCGQSLSLEAMSGGGGAPSGGPGHNPSPSGGTGPGGRAVAFRPRGRVGAARGVPDHNSARIRGCPNCRKALPRCALCLVSFDCDTPHLAGHGAPSKARGKPRDRSSDDDALTAPASDDDPRFDSGSMSAFARWFTWCQACRHGGHADHMADWFKGHDECPVTDCKCRCNKLDRMDSREGATGDRLSQQQQQSQQQVQHQASVDAQLRANQHLANQQAAYHQHQQSYQNQALLQASLQLQYPQGLPSIDVVTLAQAIQLVQMSRGVSNSGGGQTVPAGGLAAEYAPYTSPSQAQPMFSPNSPSPTMMSQMQHAASSPYLLHGIAESTRPTNQQQQQQQQQAQVASQTPNPQQQQQQQPVLPRPVSAINVSGRSVTAGPAVPKGNFPLTRW